MAWASSSKICSFLSVMTLVLISAFPSASARAVESAVQPNLKSSFSVSRDGSHMCYVKNDETVRCLGRNIFSNNLAGLMNGAISRKVIANPESTCIITLGRTVKCVGSFAQGEIVIPENWNQVTSISLSLFNLCSITIEQRVRCIGSFGEETAITENMIPADWTSITQIFAHPSYICSINTRRELKCIGQILTGSPSTLTTINLPKNPTIVSAISTNDRGFCLIDSSKELFCLGLLAYAIRSSSGTLSAGFQPMMPGPDDNEVGSKSLVAGLSGVNLDPNGKNVCVVGTLGWATCWGHIRWCTYVSCLDEPIDSAKILRPGKVVEVNTSSATTCFTSKEGNASKSKFTVRCEGYVRHGTSLISPLKIEVNSKDFRKTLISDSFVCVGNECQGYVPTTSVNVNSSRTYTRSFRIPIEGPEALYNANKLLIGSSGKKLQLSIQNPHPIGHLFCDVKSGSKNIGSINSQGKFKPREVKGYFTKGAFAKAGTYKLDIDCGIPSSSPTAYKNDPDLAQDFKSSISVK